MTREEAKKEATTTRYNLVYDVNSSLNNPRFSLIDEIYDDFESRTCESCASYDGIYCEHDDTKYLFGGHGISSDFGCNKWVAKDDK